MSTTHDQSHRPPQGAPLDAAARDDGRQPAPAPRPVPVDATLDGTSDTKDLKNLPVRGLLAELARIESRLRTTPFLLTEAGGTRVNPEAARLLARQRAVITQLRARRVTWASSEAREPSAAWPPPPWS
jgi:hypothetical protein